MEAGGAAVDRPECLRDAHCRVADAAGVPGVAGEASGAEVDWPECLRHARAPAPPDSLPHEAPRRHGTLHYDDVMPLLGWLDWVPLVGAEEELRLLLELEAGSCFYENERWTHVWERVLCRGYAGFSGPLPFEGRATELLTRKVQAMGRHPGAVQLELMALTVQRRSRESRASYLASLSQRQLLRVGQVEGWLLDLGKRYLSHLQGLGRDVRDIVEEQYRGGADSRLAPIRAWAAAAGIPDVPEGWVAASGWHRWHVAPDVPPTRWGWGVHGGGRMLQRAGHLTSVHGVHGVHPW